MSFAELKQEIDRLTVEEKEQLRRYLAIQKAEGDPNWPVEMDRRIDRTLGGLGHGAEELHELHDSSGWRRTPISRRT